MTPRIAQLTAEIKQPGLFGSIGCIGFVLLALAAGGILGSSTGWGVALIGLFVVSGIAKAEQNYRRRKYEAFFVRREFDQPEPVFQQTHTPPPRQDPPPRQQPPPRQDPPKQDPPPEVVKVTSLPQAFGILGLPPGKVTKDDVRKVYRRLMAEYHPDKVAHLGPELRALAAKKTVQFNLAMQFIEDQSRH